MATLKVIGVDSSTGEPKISEATDTLIPSSGGNTIYSADDTLASNRAVSQAAFSLDFNSVNGTQTTTLNKTAVQVVATAANSTGAISNSVNVTNTKSSVKFNSTASGIVEVAAQSLAVDLTIPATGRLLLNAAYGNDGDVITANTDSSGVAQAPTWSPAGVLAISGTINLFTVANTTVYTVPTGRTAIITGAVVRCSAASSVSAPATAGIGFDAGGSNVFSSQSMTGLLLVSDCWGFMPIGKYVAGAAASTLKFGVDVGATGTSQSAVVYILGFLI